MAECPHCHAEVEADREICPRCDITLAAAPASCPECARPIDSSWKLCPFCGVRLGTSGDSGQEAGSELLFGTHTVEHLDGRDPPELLAVGQRYVVGNELGRGGMGVVYRARDTRLGIEVALKRLTADSIESEVAIRRFLSEGKVVAALNHVNIVRVHDMDEDGEGLFIIMELVGGRPLDQLLAESAGAFSEDRALSLIRGIAAGLSYAHRKGVIHRDVKPANVLVTDDQVPKLVDFGLARAGSASSISASGFGMGTFDYAAPEQKRDARSADHRADIYALGCTFYELLTGRKPPPHPDGIPDQWAELILKATHPDPASRYFSVDDFLRDLDRPNRNRHRRAAAFEDEPEGTCASCGTLNNLEARFCRSCGEGLFTNCPSCRDEIRSGVKHCTRCGVSPDAVGTALAHLEKAEQYEAGTRLSRAMKELTAVLTEFENGRLADSDPRIALARESQTRVSALQQKAQSLWSEGEEAHQSGDLELAASVFKEAADLDSGLAAAGEEKQEEISTERSRLLTRSRLDQAGETLSDGHPDHALQLLAEESPFEELEQERVSLLARVEEQRARFDQAIEQVGSALKAGDLRTAITASQAAGRGLRNYSPAGPVLSQLTRCQETCAADRQRMQEAKEALLDGKLDAAMGSIGEKSGFLELHPLFEELQEGIVSLRESLDECVGRVRELHDEGRIPAARGAADEYADELLAYSPGAALLQDLEDASRRYEEEELRLHDAAWFLKAREIENARRKAIPEVSFPALVEERKRLLTGITERWQDLEESAVRIERAIETGKLIPALSLASRRRSEFGGFDRGKQVMAALTESLHEAGYTLSGVQSAFEEKEYERSLEILEAVTAMADAEEPKVAELRAAIEAAMSRRDQVLAGIDNLLDRGGVQQAIDLEERRLPALEALRLPPQSKGWHTLSRLDEAREAAEQARRRKTIILVAVGAVILIGVILGMMYLL